MEETEENYHFKTVHYETRLGNVFLKIVTFGLILVAQVLLHIFGD